MVGKKQTIGNLEPYDLILNGSVRVRAIHYGPGDNITIEGRLRWFE
jgi:hypothetical protein